MALFQLLLIGTAACGGVAMLSAYAAWPKLRALAARGVVKTLAPDLLEGRTNSPRAGALIWLTPIPADRTRLRRLLLICRIAQVGSLLFFSAALATTGMEGPVQRTRHGDAGPVIAPVVLKEPAA